MINLKPYFRRTDDDGHIYLVPQHLIDEFDKWLESEYDTDEFDKGLIEYEPYRLGGDDSDIKYWIHESDYNPKV